MATPPRLRRIASRPQLVTVPKTDVLSYEQQIAEAQRRMRGVGNSRQGNVVEEYDRLRARGQSAAAAVAPQLPPRATLQDVLANQREILRRLDALGSSQSETKREVRELNDLIVAEFGVGQGVVPQDVADLRAAPEQPEAPSEDVVADEADPDLATADDASPSEPDPDPTPAA